MPTHLCSTSWMPSKPCSYPELLRELRDSFHETAEALECADKRPEKDAKDIQRHLDSSDKLEEAHRTYLLELQRLVK